MLWEELALGGEELRSLSGWARTSVHRAAAGLAATSHSRPTCESSSRGPGWGLARAMPPWWPQWMLEPLYDPDSRFGTCLCRNRTHSRAAQVALGDRNKRGCSRNTGHGGTAVSAAKRGSQRQSSGSNVSISWELAGSADSQGQPRPPESGVLRADTCFNKPFRGGGCA